MNERNKKFFESDAGKAWLAFKVTGNPYIASIWLMKCKLPRIK